MRFPTPSLAALLLVAASAPSAAEVTASDAWVRATVPAQTSTAAYLTLHASGEARVVGVRSPAAKLAEIHSTSMDKGVMSMGAVDELRIARGAKVELKPGGYHVMLMGLARPLAAGDKVPITLLVEEGGKRRDLGVVAEVRPLGR
jgi:copper(I)-binding protein